MENIPILPINHVIRVIERRQETRGFELGSPIFVEYDGDRKDQYRMECRLKQGHGIER